MFSQQVLQVKNLNYSHLPDGKKYPNGLILDDLIRRLLSKLPEDRPSTMEIEQLLNLPIMEVKEQAVYLSYLQRVVPQKRMAITQLHDNVLQPACEAIERAKCWLLDYLERVDNLSFVALALKKLVTKTTDDLPKVVEFVLHYLMFGGGEAGITALGLKFGSWNEVFYEADDFILSDEVKLAVLAVGMLEAHPEQRELLASLFESDTTALLSIRQGFIDNGDPGSSEVYEFSYALNESLANWLREEVLE